MSYSKYYYYSLIYSVLAIIVAIISNLLLIPRYGMVGAALGTLITQIVLAGIIVLVNKWKGGLLPFNKKTVLVVSFFVMIMLIDNFLQFESYLIIFNGLKTILLLGLFTFLAYKFEISTQINGLIKQFLARLGIQIGQNEESNK